MSTGGMQRQGGAHHPYCCFTPSRRECRCENGLKMTQVQTGVTDDATYGSVPFRSDIITLNGMEPKLLH